MINKIVEKFISKLFDLLIKKIESLLNEDLNNDGKIG